MTDARALHVFLTGGNTGIGLATAQVLVASGHHVWLACRSEEKTRPVIAELMARHPTAKVEFVPLDLGDHVSVRAAAARVIASGLPVDVLLANAGVAGQRGFTKDGFELAFGTNHLGHFLLTKLLLPQLEAAGRARVVVVASKAHYRAKAIDWEALREPTRTITGLPEYSVSKLCNVLFARELARRVDSKRISTYALHPGVVASDAWRRIPWPFRSLVKLGMLSNEEGAKTSLFCALSPEVADKTGLYWDTSAEKRPSRLALDDTLARELWEKSEAWIAAQT